MEKGCIPGAGYRYFPGQMQATCGSLLPRAGFWRQTKIFCLSLEDSSIALIKTREALRTTIIEKKKLYKSLETTKPNDALLLEMDTFLKAMNEFSVTPIDAITIYLKTPKDDRTIKMGRDYNLAINAYNTELVPAINNFSVKMQEYKQKNIPPRKTKYKVVSSED